MSRQFHKQLLTATFSIASALFCTLVQAAPLTFASAPEYDNNAVQASGYFRDVLGGSFINRGNDFGTGAYTALNFTGSGSTDVFDGSMTLYDTTPGPSQKTLFTGNLSVSLDFLVDQFNNSKGPGILFLYNEGAGMQGLSLSVFDGGGTDSLALVMAGPDGVGMNAATTLAKTNLSGGVDENKWYRLALELSFSGSNYTVTGQVFSHQTPTNPNSVAVTQVGSTLSYTGALSGSLVNPYEIGLDTRGGTGTVLNTSITNFSVAGDQLAAATSVPEPGSLALLGLASMGLLMARRRK